MDDSSVPIFAQAKLEYTKQLVDVLYMNMYDGLRSIYDDSKKLYNQKTTSIIVLFRSLLEKVPTWNTEIIDSETERIMKSSKCDWLDDLLTAVFISHTRILMSIGPNQNYNKINVTIPKTSTFIHKSYINIAREVWKNPYLLNEQVPAHEYQRNMKQLEDMIKLTIEDTIRRQLPIKEILREHLETYDEPKQSTQKPIDMQMIMNEIKKANLQQTKEEPESDELGPEVELVREEEPESVKENDIVFNKEEDEDKESLVINSYIPSSNPYKDSEDPSDKQIQNATQDIVINDITEPVVEATYDNTDIVTGKDTTNDDNTTKKLNDMMNELNKPSIITDPTNVSDLRLVSDPTIKPITTESKSKTSSVTSVIKIDDPTSVIKLDEVKEPEPEPEPEPFSFSNLYPNLNGTSSTVDDVKKDDVKDITNDINASIMKEVISLDKKTDEIDETITLDNFFNDVQKMVNPMEPIKEETKYTLFEDAKISE